mmetsp:Transcript_18158/g.31045  ORF Transcript_18158/g.31045 Transcript_18158/m.31045 type:complete len:220 (+) Transcript_18158:177-836(+)
MLDQFIFDRLTSRTCSMVDDGAREADHPLILHKVLAAYRARLVGREDETAISVVLRGVALRLEEGGEVVTLVPNHHELDLDLLLVGPAPPEPVPVGPELALQVPQDAAVVHDDALVDCEPHDLRVPHRDEHIRHQARVHAVVAHTVADGAPLRALDRVGLVEDGPEDGPEQVGVLDGEGRVVDDPVAATLDDVDPVEGFEAVGEGVVVVLSPEDGDGPA